MTQLPPGSAPHPHGPIITPDLSCDEYDIVIPTIGRPSLVHLLASLDRSVGPRPRWIIVVDDRRPRSADDDGLRDLTTAAGSLGERVWTIRAGGRGPAVARNIGWRATGSPWAVFLDDDVVVSVDWMQRLHDDLRSADPQVAAVQGRVRVPLPHGRLPTDWERQVRGLETARWITADLAVRRTALVGVGGFDGSFARAYREDADFALRLLDQGWELAVGRRRIDHPVQPAGRWVSVRRQLGNADDVRMVQRHGRGWRRRAGAPRGRRARHAVITATGIAALVCAARRRRWLAGLAGASWVVGTAEFAMARIAPGPKSRSEIATMIATSMAIPPVAIGSWVVAWARAGYLAPRGRRVRRQRPSLAQTPSAVLFDRDGTLVRDVPYNADPALVEPAPGARAALDRLRSMGVPIGVVTNQSGVGRGLVSLESVSAVNCEIERLLGPIGTWVVCPHRPESLCSCRKPAPGLVIAAARRLGVSPQRIMVIGDIGSDIEAAEAAGASGVLVPTDVTKPAEVATAQRVARTPAAAVAMVFGESGG